MTAELKEMNLTWGEAQHAAQDRSRWRQIGEAFVLLGTKRINNKKINDVASDAIKQGLLSQSVTSLSLTNQHSLAEC